MIIKRYENGCTVTYKFISLEDLKDKTEEWKAEFRRTNKTDKIIKMFGRDKSYERYCNELDELISDMQKVNKGQEMIVTTIEYLRDRDGNLIDANDFCKSPWNPELLSNPIRPDRLNPEDHIAEVGEMVYDSRIPENK